MVNYEVYYSTIFYWQEQELNSEILFPTEWNSSACSPVAEGSSTFDIRDRAHLSNVSATLFLVL